MALEGAGEGGNVLFDASPLQKFLLGIFKQVEACKQENVGLRAELRELKVGQRLSMLEQNVQELADMQRSEGIVGAFGDDEGDSRGGFPPLPGFDATGGIAPLSSAPAFGPASQQQQQQQQAAGATRGGMAHRAGPPRSMPGGGGGDSSWVIFEFNQLKERMGQMERKSEALWHGQVMLGATSGRCFESPESSIIGVGRLWPTGHSPSRFSVVLTCTSLHLPCTFPAPSLVHGLLAGERPATP